MLSHEQVQFGFSAPQSCFRECHCGALLSNVVEIDKFLYHYHRMQWFGMWDRFETFGCLAYRTFVADEFDCDGFERIPEFATIQSSI
jgi:hypothetical protein